MKNQLKHMIIMLVVLVLAIAAVFVARWLSVREEANESSESNVVYVTDFDGDEVTNMEFTTETGTYSIIKDGENWVSDDGTLLDADKVNQMVTKLKNITSEEELVDISKEDYGIGEDTNKIVITVGGEELTLWIGDLNEIANKYYICSSEKDGNAYLVARGIYELFYKSIEDYLPDETETTETETVSETETAETETTETETVSETETAETETTETVSETETAETETTETVSETKTTAE